MLCISSFIVKGLFLLLTLLQKCVFLFCLIFAFLSKKKIIIVRLSEISGSVCATSFATMAEFNEFLQKD